MTKIQLTIAYTIKYGEIIGPNNWSGNDFMLNWIKGFKLDSQGAVPLTEFLFSVNGFDSPSLYLQQDGIDAHPLLQAYFCLENNILLSITSTMVPTEFIITLAYF